MPILRFRHYFRSDPLLYQLASRIESACALSANTCHLQGIPTSDFWQEVYIRREQEYEEFADFLADSSKRVALISGHAGAGKSTFIAEKLSNPARLANLIAGSPSSCQGITIDLGDLSLEAQKARSKASDIFFASTNSGGQSSVSFEDELMGRMIPVVTTALVRAIRERFIQHFCFLLTEPEARIKSLDRDQTGRDLRRSHTKVNDKALLSEAERLAVAAILIACDGGKLPPLERGLLSDLDRTASKADQLDHVALKIQALETRSFHELLPIRGGDQDDVLFWSCAYASWFEHEVPVLVLDNAESLDSTVLERSVTDVALNISRSITPVVHHQGRHHAWKTILAVRDETLNRAALRYVQTEPPAAFTWIMLASAPVSRNFALDVKRKPLTSEIMEQIVQQRLEVALKSGSLSADPTRRVDERQLCALGEELRSLIKKMWFGTRADTDFGSDEYSVDLVKLTNESVRVSLEMVFHSSLDCLMRSREQVRRFGNLPPHFANFAFRERIINWFFRIDPAGPVLLKAMRTFGAQVETGTRPCCPDRLILTYLDNLMSTDCPKAEVAHARQLLYAYTRMSPEQFKEGVWTLYRVRHMDRQLITVEQKKPYRNADDLEDDAMIYINPRGRVFLRRVIQTVEYWAYLAMEADPLGAPTCVFELSPRDAVELFQAVARAVQRISAAHRRNWEMLVATTAESRRLTTVPFFINYRKLLGVGNVFFTERVTSSHLRSLLTYIVDRLRCMGILQWIAPQGVLDDIDSAFQDRPARFRAHAGMFIQCLRAYAQEHHDEYPDLPHLVTLAGIVDAYDPVLADIAHMETNSYAREKGRRTPGFARLSH